LTCASVQAMHCSACGEPLAGDYLVLSVCDNGPGIAETRIHQLFDPFYSTKQTQEKRSGLGLAVVQGLLQRYKAHVRVESELGKGSCFKLLFPPAERLASVSDEKGARWQMPDAKPSFSGHRVMLVDDEPAIILFMTDFMELQGLTVEAFTDSEQALEKFRQAPESFDLLITDQAMPMINGLELVEQVRKSRPTLPVILCSGYSDRINAANAAAFGVYRFLDKPVSPEDLLAALAGALGLAEPPGAA
jgi:CheY-like chemotaxis protein